MVTIQNQYKSNMFKFDIDDLRYRFAPLRVSEPLAWNTLRGHEIEIGPYHVGNDRVYFTDEHALQCREFQKIVNLQKIGKRKFPKVDNDAAARIVGSMIYRAFHIFFLGLGFQSFFKAVYYKQTNYYVKTIIRDEGTYYAFRGVVPKIHARDLIAFIESNSEFKIIVDDLEKFKAWTGFKVKVVKEKGYFILEDIDLEDQKVTVARQKLKSIFPIESIYIPATSETLSQRGVLEELQEFSQFRDTIAKSEFNFIDNVCKDLGVEDSIVLPLDINQSQTIAFTRSYFKEI